MHPIVVVCGNAAALVGLWRLRHCLDEGIPCSREARGALEVASGCEPHTKRAAHTVEPLQHDFLLYDQHVMALDGASSHGSRASPEDVHLCCMLFMIGWSTLLNIQIPSDRSAQQTIGCYQASQITSTQDFNVIFFFAFGWDHWHHRSLGRQAEQSTFYSTRHITG